MRKKSFLMLAPIMAWALLLVGGCGIRISKLNGTHVDGNMYKDSTIKFKEKKIGVLDFVSGGALALGALDMVAKSPSGQWAADMITTELLFDGFQVLERHYVSKLMEEQDSTLTGLRASEGQQEAIQKIGRKLGVDLMMVGAVTVYGCNQVGITSRMIDVSTGKICWVFSAMKCSGSLQTAMYGVCLAVKESLVKEKVYIWERG